MSRTIKSVLRRLVPPSVLESRRRLAMLDLIESNLRLGPTGPVRKLFIRNAAEVLGYPTFVETGTYLGEMAAHLLAMGNLDLARRFYVRAVTADPNDRNALGFLACTLARIGRIEEAGRFAQRAGPGEWSTCVAAAIPPPGQLQPPR